MFTRTRIQEIIEKLHSADIPHFIQECVQTAINNELPGHPNVRHIVDSTYDRIFKKPPFLDETV
tara:strand:- start:235 stop:426 length:192 start_codon:yes stop_codon:yes gene_type:complete